MLSEVRDDLCEDIEESASTRSGSKHAVKFQIPDDPLDDGPGNSVTRPEIDLEALARIPHELFSMDYDDAKQTDEREQSKLRRRSDEAIRKALDELWDKVWWNRVQSTLRHAERHKERMTEPQRAVIEQARQSCRKIEAKYGVENLVCNDRESNRREGRLSALKWALGCGWERSMDT